ncbi:MAG: undecaprenyl-diphosphate phosphatase [Bacteroidia bacterium]|nr:undecaprenyl-diphosphate phosphatase [Bacteroidia bacterium]
MNWLQALLLGLVQGFTEFLPVSSSGHLELGKALLGIEGESNITFTVVVHGATVLATLVVFWKEIRRLLMGTFEFRLNDETQYILKLIVSMIPVLLVGIFLESWVESFFTGNILFVGFMLLITASLLALTHFVKIRNSDKPITYRSAFIIGVVQAIATLPGISRSGSTIAAGMLLGIDKKLIAQFSFLMVLVPVIGANLMEIMKSQATSSATASATPMLPLAIGFIAAFFAGLIACTWMINLVKKGKLIWFAVYCLVIGLIAIGIGLFR